MRKENVAERKTASIWGNIRLWILCAIIVAVVGFIVWSIHQSTVAADLRAQVAEQSKQIQEQKELLAELDTSLEEEKNSHETAPVVSSETIRSSLNALSQLVTEEYTYRNADKKESSETWIFDWVRPFSKKTLVVLYDGVIKAGIDFSRIQVDVDNTGKTIIVTLPRAEITDNNIPQETIEIVEVQNGLFNDVTLDNYNDFISEQKPIMEQKAIDEGLLDRADEHAKLLVETFLREMPGLEEYSIETGWEALA